MALIVLFYIFRASIIALHAFKTVQKSHVILWNKLADRSLKTSSEINVIVALHAIIKLLRDKTELFF